MRSQNFEFLRNRRPELADLGGFAEQYCANDPASALIKLRILVEHVVKIIYDEQRLPKPFRANLHDLLKEPVFVDLVPHVILDKLHTIRIRGNRAAHGGPIQESSVPSLIREAFDVVCWFHLVFNNGKHSDLPAFIEPTAHLAAPTNHLKEENKALLKKLERQEAELQQLLTHLENERKKREELEQITQSEIVKIREKGEKQAKELDFNEAQTQKFLIDSLLLDAGWNVAKEGASTDEVGQEVPLSGLPTPSGKGFADYVLWGDNGKPLAVIEAKKTSKTPEAGRTQAQQYADALEAQYGQRPVIFYTNGVEIYLWDDAQTLPPRKIYGFYSKDSLEYLIFQRHNKEQLELVAPSSDIAGRMYQIEAIKRVTERFSDGHRKALIVQATGTGKTRVAISLCDVLIRAKWVKRILFLCDRRELRKQADRVFKEFLPSEPRTFVSANTANERDKRIYLATYPAMMKNFESFDVGFFDLIIADESHRSIYNKYRDLFYYFDALQIGLTATPVHLVNRNTYGLFGCEDKDPTAYFSFEQAIDHIPPYLVPFRVLKVTTKFQRQGIKYSQMSDEERRQLEDQVENAESVEHEVKELDRLIFNRDTNRSIIRNLMEHGIRDASGSLPGKSIIFARNHQHAVQLAEVFDELYPKYGGSFCRVIDHYDSRAEQLIDDFKNPDGILRIAISVDMLDTGIDVPEIVNLVFAKPVKSYVKFWQMIGRGTRLCPNLFGPGKHKTEFLIFDHWGNFEYFDEHYEEKQSSPPKSLMQRLFEARVELAKTCLEKMEEKSFQAIIKLIEADINALKASKVIQVRDHWRDLQLLGDIEVLKHFDAATYAKLLDIVAPLMRWVDIRGHEEAHRFDLLLAKMQIALLQQSNIFEDLRGKFNNEIEALRKNLNQVKAKAETIKKVRNIAFWSDVDLLALEDVRQELRSIIKHRVKESSPTFEPTFIDVHDSQVEYKTHIPTFEGQELIAYRQRVEGLLKEKFQSHPILNKIRAGYAVTEEELEKLAHQILQADPQVNLKHLPTNINIKGDLHRALRSIIGLDIKAVDAAFTGFMQKHPELTSGQLRFLSMLKLHICNNGGLEIDRLYEAPFTSISAEGIDGVFSDELIDELLEIIAKFNLPEILGATG